MKSELDKSKHMIDKKKLKLFKEVVGRDWNWYVCLFLQDSCWKPFPWFDPLDVAAEETTSEEMSRPWHHYREKHTVGV